MNHVEAISKVLAHEGGFVNDPSDSGGATNFGITKSVYEAFKGRTVTVADIKAMPKTEAIQIYKINYWDKIKGDQIKSYKVAYALFDQAVNRGVSASIKAAQKVLGLFQDGLIGPNTLLKLNEMPETKFLQVFLADAEAFYKNLAASRPKDAKFLKGWLNRISSISDYVGVKPAAAVSGLVFLLAAVLVFVVINSPRGKLA